MVEEGSSRQTARRTVLGVHPGRLLSTSDPGRIAQENPKGKRNKAAYSERPKQWMVSMRRKRSLTSERRPSDPRSHDSFRLVDDPIVCRSFDYLTIKPHVLARGA